MSCVGPSVFSRARGAVFYEIGPIYIAPYLEFELYVGLALYSRRDTGGRYKKSYATCFLRNNNARKIKDRRYGEIRREVLL